MAEAFDPYHIWLGIPPEEQPPHHYRLLAVKPFEINADVIESAADQRMAHLRSFQTGKHGAESQRILNELAAARLCLLTPEKRQAYDLALRPKLAAEKPPAAPPPAAPPPAAPPPAAPSPSASKPKPLAVARPLTAQPAAPAVEPATPLGFDPLEQAAVRRPTKKQRSNPSPAIYAIAGAGLLAVLAVAWIAIGSGGTGDRPMAARDAPAPPTAKDTKTPRIEEPAPGRSNAPPKAEREPAQDSAEPATDSVDSDQPAEEVAEPGEPSAETTEDMPVDGAAADDMEVAASEVTDDVATDQRTEPPGADQLAEAVAEVQWTFHDEYAAAKKPAEKTALAEKLTALADESSAASEQFALLSEARRLAIAAGNTAAVLRATEALAQSFAVDRFELLAETTKELAARDLSPAARKELAQAIEPLVDAALAACQFAQGRHLATLGVAAARKANQPDIAKALGQRGKELAAGEKLAASAADARTRLEQNPDDAEASQTLGKYLCLLVGDWPAGLPHLSRSEEPAWRSVAELETAAEQSPDAALKIGDAWWELARPGDPLTDRMHSRARHWYEQAVDSLTGLSKTRVEKRLEELVVSQSGNVASPDKTSGSVVADKLVLWNCHNKPTYDRGILICNVELRKVGKVVWSKQAIPLEWSKDKEPATIISLPKISFDAVRVETVSYHDIGPALCEIEVFRADTNLARGKPVTSSGDFDARFPAAAVVDGIRDSSRSPVGYWVAPNHRLGWVEVQVASPVESRHPRAEKPSEKPAHGQPSKASGSVMADKLVIWNCHCYIAKDRGMLSCNVELRKAGKVVWSKKAVPVEWSKDKEPATTIPLPEIAFDTLRVETASYHDLGSALCEVEVFRGETNLARGKPVASSGDFDARFPVAAVVDGIRDSSRFTVGYWAAPNHRLGWVEVQLAEPADPNKAPARKPPKKVAPSPPGNARSGIIADKLVVWNCHNGGWKDRGMLSCNVELRRAGKVVWSKQAVPLEWSEDEEPATTIPLPKIRFDALRLETATFHGWAPALFEVEIFRGDTNLARGKPVTASAVQNSDVPATALVDGITNSAQGDRGFWAAADHQLAWVEVQVAPPTRQPGNAIGTVVADKLVLWNCHNNGWKSEGMLSCNLELRKGGKVVWSKQAVPVEWSKDQEPATTIPLPNIMFDALRVETVSYHGEGPALCEVEIFRDETNFARGKSVTTSGSYGVSYLPNALVDGIRDSSRDGVGYWVAPHRQLAWVEVQVAPPAK